MRYASVCSGVEAASLAWEPLGWRPVWFSEVAAFPAAVLAHRWPDVPNLGDMTKIKGKEHHGAVDLLVGGTPCQGFSVAGKRGGMDDGRSGLAGRYIELLGSMRPKWFVWENVPGVFSSWSGAPEDEAVEEWEETSDLDQLLAGFRERGYCCAWRVLDMQHVRVDGFGRAVPQRRRRVFVVGRLGADWRYPAAVLFEPRGLLGDHPPRRAAGTPVAGALGDGDQDGGGDVARTILAKPSAALDPSMETLVAGRAFGLISRATGGNGFEEGVAPTLREGHLGANVCYALEGNTVFRGSNQHGTGISEGVAPTLNTADRHCVAFSQNDAGRDASVDVCPTLRSGGAGGVVNPAVAGRWYVRRLTPLECERLMGQPDNHTSIPWRGRPAEQCPDGPRYQACGNSMGVNVMRWIGRRIDMVDKLTQETR